MGSSIILALFGKVVAVSARLRGGGLFNAHIHSKKEGWNLDAKLNFSLRDGFGAWAGVTFGVAF